MNKARLIILLISVFFLASCSNNSSDLSQNKVNNLSSWENIVHSASEDLTLEANPENSINNIKTSQPWWDDFNTIITNQITKISVIKDFIKIWAWMISECQYDWKLYFSVDINNFSLPNRVYDQRWTQVLICDFDKEKRYQLNPMCEKLEKCKLVYVSDVNIRWYNPINKYEINLEEIDF